MAMDIRLITTEEDYQWALDEIERLFEAKLGTSEGDLLEVWTTLVEAYEAHNCSLPLPDPIEAIRYYMESRGLTRRDLEPFIGGRSRVAEVLNRKRGLSIDMIRSLHAGLGIPAEVLIQPYLLTNTQPDHSVQPA